MVMNYSWVICDGAGWQKDPGESSKEAGDCRAQGKQTERGYPDQITADTTDG